ncbi:MAG: class I SAM-dependent methyltransferase [Acidimicrobiia bacterium]
MGGGGGSIGTWLSRRVGPTGSVLVTDIDPRWMGAESGGNLKVCRHDIVEDPLPEAEFDLIHARLVLIHVPERRRALARMVAALKPGGWLILDEFDCYSVSVLTGCEPEDADLFDQVHDAFIDVVAAAGAELDWARRASGALDAAGLVDLGSKGYLESWPGGSAGCDLHRANFEQLRDKIIASGAVKAEDLDRVAELLVDPAFAVTSYLLVSTWGAAACLSCAAQRRGRPSSVRRRCGRRPKPGEAGVGSMSG